MTISRKIQTVITVSAAAIALVHVYFPDFKVDGVIVSLFAIAVIPWLGPVFKAIELPGGLKVEYKDLVDAGRKVAEAGLISPSVAGVKSRHVYAFESVVGNDPNLALAGLRIEIESRLRDLAKTRQIQVGNAGLPKLIQELRAHAVLNDAEISAIHDLLPLLNSATHGAKVDERASQWALDVGTRILQAFDERRGETDIPHLLEKWRRRSGGGVAEIGTQLSKAFVKSPRAFLKCMRDDPDSFSAWLDRLDVHTFTIFESGGEVEDDLYTAYYEKLKSLMLNAAQELVESEYKNEAKRVMDVLRNTKIMRIW